MKKIITSCLFISSLISITLLLSACGGSSNGGGSNGGSTGSVTVTNQGVQS